MLQNTNVKAFIIFELLRENQKGGGKITPTPHLCAQIMVKGFSVAQNCLRPKSAPLANIIKLKAKINLKQICLTVVIRQFCLNNAILA